MPRSRFRIPSVLLSLAALSSAALAQASRPLNADELTPVVAAARGWLEARAAGRDPAQAREALERALEQGRKAAGGGHALRWSSDLGRALRLARGAERPDERPGSVVELEAREGVFARNPLGWAYRLPREYDPNAGPYPLILTLPDLGETPAEHIRTHWSEAALRDGAIVVAPSMPAGQAEWTRVSLSGRAGGLCHALTVLRLAEERFAVDPDRVYVVGRGKSVPAALAAGDAFPQRFAGVVGRAGDAGESMRPDNLLDLPVLLTGGGARATALSEAARAAGVSTIELRSAATELEIWTWMGEHPRLASPERVVPGDPFPTRAYWLRIAPTAPDARVEGRIDLGSNSIAIEGHGFSRATLYLTDALLDLDKPLRVVCNGVQRELTVRRSLSTALDLWTDGTSDGACVYVAEVAIDAAIEAGEGDALVSSPDIEFAGRLAAAGEDPDLLWQLARWCWENERVPAGTRTLEKLLRIDPEHAEARKALGHVRGFERWFPSQDALDRFAVSQDEAVARSRGYVQQRSMWINPGDRTPFSKGLTKDTFTGQWLGLDETKRLAGGWARQDLDWIEPTEAGQVDLGLWRVDGEWLELADAERRHASVERMWSIPGPEIQLHTTVERNVAARAAGHMQRALDDLRKVFGVEPTLPLDVALLHDEEQYDLFAFGAPDGRRRPTHAARLHTVHMAFFAESWFGNLDGKPIFRGMGVGYWDAHVPDGDAYGVHSARLATGLSYVEAIDPSPKAVRKVARAEPTAEYLEAYRAEKRLPEWLRRGGAVYAERYFEDATVGEGGDRWWARRWSLANLRERGGLRPLGEVLSLQLDPEKRDDSLKLLIESGLLVAFAVDGGCAPVAQAHAELRRVLAEGSSPTKAVAALEEALRANEDALRAFAAAE
jgi:poly(3-hydroxybutyrate) depolymerase